MKDDVWIFKDSFYDAPKRIMSRRFNPDNAPDATTWEDELFAPSYVRYFVLRKELGPTYNN